MTDRATDTAVTTGNWEGIKTRANFAPRSQVLDFCVALCDRIPGNIIEFGVAKGDSTRAIREALLKYNPPAPGLPLEKQIFACDSFEGLREKFENAEVGAFACEPPQIPGVRIVKGYFEDSLTPELAREVGKISFAHLDADLYSSTYCALEWLTPLLQTGTLLLFDEFIGEKNSEMRAFQDWGQKTGIETILIAEFGREPSGWGKTTDRRTVYQVIGQENLPAKPRRGTKYHIKRYLKQFGWR